MKPVEWVSYYVVKPWWKRLVRKPAKRLRIRRDQLLARARSLPVLWAPEEPVERPNGLFSRSEQRRLRGHAQRAAHREPGLVPLLADAHARDVRAWEYGTLLGLLQHQRDGASRRALDVGSGNSAFPRYLVATGHAASMTTLDLPDAHEARTEHTARRDADAGVERVPGSMLELPFADAEFDLVTCISAIEHLDGEPVAHKWEPESNPRRPHEAFVGDTRRALAEMARVLAPGGLLFVTTDAYVPERQHTDAWSSPRGDRPIFGAYHFGEIESVFASTLRDAGLELVGEPSWDLVTLERDDDASTYRGRWFTTFAVCATAKAAGR